MALHLILAPQDWLFVAGTAFGVLLTNAVEFIVATRRYRGSSGRRVTLAVVLG